MCVNDTPNGYGWISIALHWITAVTVVAMLTIGLMSQGAARGEHLRFVHLHTTIGVAVYALLWGRIVWRFKVGHPGPLPRQGRFFFTIGKYFHFAMLTAIAVPKTHDALRRVHGVTASFILAGMILHVLAVFKHTVIDRDGTFDKIMVADRGNRR